MKVEDLEDPIEVIEEILSRIDPAVIQKLYNLPLAPDGQPHTDFGTTLEFLTMLAMASGRLLKVKHLYVCYFAFRDSLILL